VGVAQAQRDPLDHKDFRVILGQQAQRDLQAQVQADYLTKQAMVENY
jgi:hypothetical protein